MFSSISNKLSAVIRTIDVRMLIFVLLLVLFVVGAGAPGATGLNTG
jgi:hypothetical protein